MKKNYYNNTFFSRYDIFFSFLKPLDRRVVCGYLVCVCVCVCVSLCVCVCVCYVCPSLYHRKKKNTKNNQVYETGESANLSIEKKKRKNYIYETEE